MNPSEAERVLRHWYETYLQRVARLLAWYGVAPEDRPDLVQEVFWAAYVALLRSKGPIEKPRAWLGEFCNKLASNYRRKAQRRAEISGQAAHGEAIDPEQTAARRELLCRLFAELDEEEQDIVLAVRLDGAPWDAIAREHGLSIERARYLYRRAMERMEQALARWKQGADERGAWLLPLALGHLFDAAPDAPDLSPDVQRRIWQSLDRRTGGAAPDDTDRDRGESRASPISIQIHTQASPGLASGLAMLGGGMAIGLVAGLLLHDRIVGRVPPDPPPSVAATAPLPVTTYASRDILVPRAEETEAAPAPSARAPRRPTAPEPRRDTAARADAQTLLDWARAAIDAGDTGTALAKLDEHARRFAQGSGTGTRKKLLERACAIESARGAPACARR